MVTVIEEVDVQEEELIVQVNCVLPAALGDSVIVEFGELEFWIVTPALFGPLIVHNPVSPEFNGVLADSA